MSTAILYCYRLCVVDSISPNMHVITLDLHKYHFLFFGCCYFLILLNRLLERCYMYIPGDTRVYNTYKSYCNV